MIFNLCSTSRDNFSGLYGSRLDSIYDKISFKMHMAKYLGNLVTVGKIYRVFHYVQNCQILSKTYDTFFCSNVLQFWFDAPYQDFWFI